MNTSAYILQFGSLSHVVRSYSRAGFSSSWGAETKCMLSGPPAHHNTDVHEGVHAADESTGKSTADNVILENTQQKSIIKQIKVKF